MYLPWVVLHKLKSSPKGIGRLLNDHEHRVPRPTGTLGLTVLNPVTPSPSTSQRNVHESITYPGTLLTLPFKRLCWNPSRSSSFLSTSPAVYGAARSWTQLSDFTFTLHFHAVEKEMATHSSVLAWRVPGMGEPGGLLSMGSHRVGHDWSDLAAAESRILCVAPYNKHYTFLHNNPGHIRGRRLKFWFGNTQSTEPTHQYLQPSEFYS